MPSRLKALELEPFEHYTTSWDNKESNTYLVLNEELDTLDGSSGSFRYGSGDTTHYWCDELVDERSVLKNISVVLFCFDISKQRARRKQKWSGSSVRIQSHVLKKSTTKP